MTTTLKAGDRVRAKDLPRVGERFRGLVGTVQSLAGPTQCRVIWDNPPGENHGGTWSRESLEVIESEVTTPDPCTQSEIVALNAENEGLYTEIVALNAVVHAARADAEKQSMRVETLTHELARANERVEELRDRNDKLLRVNRYAHSLLPEADQPQLHGFADAVNGVERA